MPSAPPVLIVKARTGSSSDEPVNFSRDFIIGRGEDCDLRIQSEYVSRQHAKVSFQNGDWWIEDLGSSNGIFVDGQQVKAAPVRPTLETRLGVEGPELFFAVQVPPPEQSGDQTAVYVAHYFDSAKDGGEHTQRIRRAFQSVQSKQKRKYRAIVAGLAVLILAIGGYAWYQNRQLQQRLAIAQELFYAMKSMDVDIASVERLVAETQNTTGLRQVRTYQTRRRELEKNYDRFLTTLRVYDPKLTEEQRLILRVSRIFGECELALPPGFMDKVHEHIVRWQSSRRLSNALQTARTNGYLKRITDELLAQNLPPHLIYVALQESDFNAFISGPPTRKGIAKGMWQFIPETGVKYGLRIGPLADFRRPDIADDRHNWEKATVAAARYLKDLYTTDAQASGLLVVASYNWGEDNVIPLIRKMPQNPRERNFWRLLVDYSERLPEETYDYVLNIVSVAVICENPRLFGFDFESPLSHLESR